MAAGDGPIRYLLGSSRHLTPADRLDVLLHAVAQGPGQTRLDVWGDGPDRPRLELVSRAYGLEDRVRFVDPSGAPAHAAVAVYPSAANLETSLVRPGVRPSLAMVSGAADAERVGFAGLVERTYGQADPPSDVPSGDDSVLSGSRIAIVTNIPTHYRVPLFGEVARRVEAAGGRLQVLFLARTYRRRAWMRPPAMDFDHTFLRSVGLPLSRERHPFVPVDLGSAVDRFAPTLIVAGGLSPAVTGQLAWSRRGPIAIWDGGTVALAPGGLQGRIRRSLASRAVAGLAYGAAAARYLHGIAPRLPVVIVRNATPVPGTPHSTPSDPVEILTVADLSSTRKGVDLLLDALAPLAGTPWRMTVVGGGPQLQTLRRRASERRIADRVTFTGAIPSDEVLERYRRASLFALASRAEIFGLALVEAMAQGLAAAVSEDVAAIEDLCDPGRNAVVVRPNAVPAWTAALADLLRDGGRRAAIGAAARATVRRRWTMEHSVDAFVAGLRLGLLARGRA